MKYYDGPKPDDLRPVGGGSYNKMHVGSEMYNFSAIGRSVYGFIQTAGGHRRIALQRIHPEVVTFNRLQHVLVIFVAVDPEKRRQKVVGWYNDATVYRQVQKSRSKKRKRTEYFAKTYAANAVLLPVTQRDWNIPAGRGGIGQANICYLYDSNGKKKRLPWVNPALRKIENWKLARR